MGVERLLALIAGAGRPTAQTPDVYLVHSGAEATRLAWRVAEELRAARLSVVLHCGGGSFKSQMKRADASGAQFAVIIGDNEATDELVAVKPLREQADTADHIDPTRDRTHPDTDQSKKRPGWRCIAGIRRRFEQTTDQQNV